MQTKFKTLLSIDSNAKTVKGQEIGFLTGILYMAPADLSGKNVCAMAEKAKCKDPCLFSAGRGAMNSVQIARMKKTELFFSNRNYFMQCLVEDICKLVKKARKKNLIPLVRLNGTSDIKYENISFTDVCGTFYNNIMEAFPGVQFYDYTKIANRRNIPANYDLTFSYSGVEEFSPYVAKAIQSGMRIAVVFKTQASIPAMFMGMQCVDGDNSDVRHLDDKGVVIALYAKGKAKADTSGFVVDMAKVFPIAIAA